MVLGGLLFDVDGTVVDHETAATLALSRALEATPRGNRVDHARARQRWKELEESAMRRYLSGELTFAEQRRLRVVALVAEFDLGVWDDAQADAWFGGYLRHYESAWRRYPDVRPALDALAARYPRLRIGALTNGDADQQRGKLRSVGLAAELAEVVASSEVGAAKPEAKIFHQGCARLGLSPVEVAYVGDRPETDAVAATNAGLRGIWLNRDGAPVRAGLPTVRTLDELPSLIAELDR